MRKMSVVVSLVGVMGCLSPAGAADTESGERTEDSRMDEILVIPQGRVADEVTNAPAVVAFFV